MAVRIISLSAVALYIYSSSKWFRDGLFVMVLPQAHSPLYTQHMCLNNHIGIC